MGTTYYAKAYATNSFGTNYGDQKTFVPALSYCTPPASTNPCTLMYITNITTTGGITNFNNTTACAATSFTNYSTTLSVSQAPGSTVTMSFTSYQYAFNYAVWVDFNDDGTFAAAEKMISLSNSSLTGSTSFTVPADAALGSHRMRVRGEYNGNAIPSDPCAALAYGETEDYSLIVANPAPANPTSVTANYTVLCNGASTTLTANGAVGTLTTIWHDNLSRPSLRNVEVFCEHRTVVIAGDDWFGPVTWSNADGTTGSLEGEELLEKTAPLAIGDANPDGAFIKAAVNGNPGFPDFSIALEAHRIVEAMYRSARDSGNAVRVASVQP
jgi:hypothetical protein